MRAAIARAIRSAALMSVSFTSMRLMPCGRSNSPRAAGIHQRIGAD
ncbi:MAG: hypothetical protein WAT70_02245 [Rhizobiaceae bacterium]